ncbi:MAG: DUF4139 domain-containing protein [Planctomycetes bacterium]|nr:DUF4139 domain-containing protein [Planctomycetota bacterium]
MTVEAIACESRISRVVVYARGAVVTRTVELPVGLASEAVELVIGGVTPLAEQGSVRTHVEGERRITGVQAPLVWVKPDEPAPVSVDLLRPKQREARRYQLRLERLQFRLNYLQSISLSSDLSAPEADTDDPVEGVGQRVGTALETSDLIHELLSNLDAEIRSLTDKAKALATEIAELNRRPVTKPRGGPRREVRVTLAPGSEHLRALEISYSVDTARWWPAYSARLSNGGKQAEFAVEAFVAQYTQEDWTDAKIGLCTADMARDLTLPELQSLRLGRRQEPKRSGFREPPEGLDALFEGHDQAFGANLAPPPPDERMIAYAEPPDEDDYDDEIAGAADYAVAESSVMMDEEIAEEPRKERRSRDRASGAKAAKKMAAPAAPAGAPMSMSRSGGPADFGAGGGALASAQAFEPEPEPTGVDDQWLDFDSLIVAPPGDSRRGRLIHKPANAYTQAWEYRRELDSLAVPAGASDPLYSRGMFDHQFDADGLLEVTSGGQPQRVRLLSKAAKSRMTFRCVPLEDERVFREVEVENPLDAPLLPGPIDVFMDGALLVTSRVEAVDRGGVIRFGLGEEQRVRVARNVRAREESKGVFGGKIAMDHDVSFEISSSLAGEIELELVDRLPVSDDKDIDVELVSSTPKAERYSQDDRHAHVRGGLRWKLGVKPATLTEVNLTYRIGFDKDYELVGGNRRD